MRALLQYVDFNVFEDRYLMLPWTGMESDRFDGVLDHHSTLGHTPLHRDYHILC